MKAYLAILSARFRMLLQYRAAALAGLGTQLFWGLIRVMVFEAFYRSADAPQPMSLQDTVTYLWLTQAMLHLIPFRVDAELAAMVRDGTVVYELARPMDLYWAWYARAIAMRTAPTILRALPMFAIALPFLGMRLPPTGWSFAAFVVSIGGAVLLTSAVTSLANISLFWTLSGQGVSNLLQVGVMFLAGMYVPLPLLPDWAQGVLTVLPFRGIMDVPFRLWSGDIPPAEAPLLVVPQLAWSAAFILLGRWMLGRGTRRLVLQGG